MPKVIQKKVTFILCLFAYFGQSFNAFSTSLKRRSTLAAVAAMYGVGFGAWVKMKNHPKHVDTSPGELIERMITGLFVKNQESFVSSKQSVFHGFGCQMSVRYGFQSVGLTLPTLTQLSRFQVEDINFFSDCFRDVNWQKLVDDKVIIKNFYGTFAVKNSENGFVLTRLSDVCLIDPYLQLPEDIAQQLL